MIVRTLDDLKEKGGYQEKPGSWSSARYLLKQDGVGFTLTQTHLVSGTLIELEYKNHIEANLVITGEAELTDVSSGITWQLGAGSMYTLDKHDRHRLRAITELHLVCVFTPALTGLETHDKDGSYPLLD